MQGEQLSIYDIEYPKYKITKPIKLIELFSGIGTQALALKYLGVSFEHYKTCEWAIKSIQAYKDIHFTDVDVELNPKRTKEDMVEFLYQKGISSNYNEPMTKQQISRLSEEQLKTIIKNIAITHNLVNIQQVKGEDLEIVDTDKYDYIMTYSFPCQDLSNAGKGKGMSDTSTRSGMLWEVERILGECENKPQVLLMENVPQVHSQDNLADFNKWKLRLEELGYNNYFQDLIATDYGIPQTRNRTFMVSILGDYSYTFPKPIPLKLKLKDMLEDNVDEKYYLSDKMLSYLQSRMPSGENKITVGISVGNRESLENAGTITTNSGNRATDNFIIENNEYDYSKERGKIINVYDKYNIQSCCKQIYNLNYYNHEQSNRVYSPEYSCPTLRTKYDEAGTIKIEENNLRIRKLTPKECFRLMGVKDEDFDNVCKNQSDSSLYHLAGDSIVVNVLMAIFKELL